MQQDLKVRAVKARRGGLLGVLNQEVIQYQPHNVLVIN